MKKTFSKSESVTRGRLRLFSLYLDFPAAVAARWVTTQISGHAGGQWKAAAEMWKLDSLTTGGSISKMAAEDAAAADVLIVTLSSLARRETELVQWLDALAPAHAQRAATGLFIGLLGGQEPPPDELDWTVKHLLRSAQRTDRDFIWRWMGSDTLAESGWLKKSVDALLARKQSVWDLPILPALDRPPAPAGRFTEKSPIRL